MNKTKCINKRFDITEHCATTIKNKYLHVKLWSPSYFSFYGYQLSIHAIFVSFSEILLCAFVIFNNIAKKV